MTEETVHIQNTFGKAEKLCSEKAIERLFTKGDSFIAYPLRIVYFIEEGEDEETDGRNKLPSILINVSKKKFKRAVKRNRVKRLVREAYRLNKSLYSRLLEDKNKRIDIAFLYLKNELPTYEEIEKAIIKAANILTERIKGK